MLCGAGALRGRCFNIETGEVGEDICSLGPTVWSSYDYYWTRKDMEVTAPASVHVGGAFLCAPMEEFCMQLGENPGRHTVDFDDIGHAVMSIFQVMTLEGWADLCYQIQDSVGYWHWMYFVLLIMIGPMFALQLFLVVIATRHAELTAEAKHEETDADELPGDEVPVPDSNKVAPEPENATEGEVDGNDSPLDLNSKTQKKELTGYAKWKWKLKLFAKSDLLSNVVMAVILLSTVFMAMKGLCENDPDDCDIAQGCIFSGYSCAQFQASLEIINLIFTLIFVFELLVKVFGLGPVAFCTKPGWKMNIFDTIIVVMSVVEFGSGIQNAQCFLNYFDGKATEDLHKNWNGKPGTGPDNIVTVKDMFGEDNVLSITDIPTMELAPAWKESILNIPRIIKSIEDGGYQYNYMMYDFCAGSGGAAVLRALRLVRLVKFMRNFPEVTKQFKILADVMGSIIALLVLILIMIFIFTIFGMNILGGAMVGEWPPEDGLVPGQEVYVHIPWDMNPRAGPRHGKIHWFDFDNHPRAPYKVEIEWGGNKGGGGGYDPYTNESLADALDEFGYIWAATKDEANVGVAIITDYTPRFNFDNLGIAFLTSFQVFTMANWNDDLYDVMGSTGAVEYSMYFYVNIILGNWVLLNLFIAILIGKFSEQRAEALEENLEVMQQRLLEKLGNLSDAHLYKHIQELFDEIDLDGSGEIDIDEFNEALVKLGVKLKRRELQDLVKSVDEDGSGRISFSEFMAMIKNIMHQAKVNLDNKKLDEQMQLAQNEQDEVMENREPVAEERLPVSCCCLEQENSFRRACLILSNEDSTAYGGGWKGKIGPVFGNFILACILMSTVCLAMFTPYTGEISRMTDMLNIIDYVLNAAFTVELIAKLVALGWKTFIKSGWNKLDLFIVFTSDLDMILTEALRGSDVPLSALRIFRVFRIFRALRPLRIIARARGVRLLVGTLVSAVKPVSVTLAIAVVALFLLGIFFVQFMGGRMKSCSDGGVFTKPECSGLDDDGAPRSWGPGDVNFDNIWSAFVAMFILSSQDDWPSHMFASMDGTGSLTGMKNGGGASNTVLAPFFFVVALLLTSAIVINMFVGVFVDCYYGAMAAVDGESGGKKNPPLNPKLLNKIFDDPREGGRSHVFKVVTTSKFDMFIAFFIVFNVLAMATESFQPSVGQLAFDAWANWFFTLIFAWEKLFKMYAFTPRRYFEGPGNGWNKFDTFIVHISFVGVFLDNAGSLIPMDASMLRILRIFRIFRILRAFRIFRSLQELQNIVMALGRSAGQVGNLLLLLMLLFFIFGVLAVNIGGNMCVDGDNEPPPDVLENHPLYGVRCAITSEGALLETHGHFQGVGVSLLTLWRVATSDAWGDIMNAVSLVPGDRTLSSDLLDSYESVFGEKYDNKAFLMHPDEVKDKELKDGLKQEGLGAEHEESVMIAMKALVEYNQTVTGDSGEDGGDYLQLASIALPDCLREDEANFLSLMGLLDCTNIGDGFSSGPKLCPGTCGFNFAGMFYSQMVSKIYFILFVCISQFVLLQLVIAVLMDQLTATQDEDAEQYRKKAPGCEELKVATFTRIYRRFNFQARRKLLHDKRNAVDAAKAAKNAQTETSEHGEMGSRQPA
jgi:hypothetical protein